MNPDKKCPRCGAELRTWDELTEEEQELVRRLPASADYGAARRRLRHRWCPRCWYEDLGDEERSA